MNKRDDILDLDLNEIKDIAESIRQFSNVAQQLADSGLKERAIVVLLKDCTGVPQKTIKTILDNLPRLKQLYLSK